MRTNALVFVACGGLLAVLLGACKPMSPEEKGPTASPKTSSDGVPVTTKAAPRLNIGDVEFAVRIEGVLSPESEADNVSVEELINKKNELDMTTISVKPPFPKELWVTFGVKCRSNFAQRPVALRAKVVRDGETLDTFSTLLGEHAEGEPFSQDIDILAGLDSAPETMLVHTEGEVMFLPKDAVPGSVDIDGLSPRPEELGHVLSNPVRVNFGIAEETP